MVEMTFSVAPEVYFKALPFHPKPAQLTAGWALGGADTLRGWLGLAGGALHPAQLQSTRAHPRVPHGQRCIGAASVSLTSWKRQNQAS